MKKKLTVVTFFVLFLSAISYAQNNQHTENKADQVLRGSGRVNPSSLGMEIDIALGSYPGRGINVPVGLSYSSKQWRLEYSHSSPRPQIPAECITKSFARYSETAASG